MNPFIAIPLYFASFGGIIWFFTSLGLKKEDKVALDLYFKKYLDPNSLSRPTMEELQDTGKFKCELKSLINQTFKGKGGYRLFLQTPYWRSISERCRKHVNYKCKKCGRSNTQLDVHHPSYDIHGEEQICWPLLLVLCNDCHKSAHRGITISALKQKYGCEIEYNNQNDSNDKVEEEEKEMEEDDLDYSVSEEESGICSVCYESGCRSDSHLDRDNIEPCYHNNNPDCCEMCEWEKEGENIIIINKK